MNCFSSLGKSEKVLLLGAAPRSRSISKENDICDVFSLPESVTVRGA